jgi:hypothetical protein
MAGTPIKRARREAAARAAAEAARQQAIGEADSAIGRAAATPGIAAPGRRGKIGSKASRGHIPHIEAQGKSPQHAEWIASSAQGAALGDDHSTRPVEYTEQLGQEVVEHIASGSVLKDYCSQPGKPSSRTIYRWIAKHPKTFGQAYLRARETRALSRIDMMDDLVRRVVEGQLDPNAARVAIDALKWQAGKENQLLFGDRTTHEIKAEVIHRDETPLQMIERARRIAFFLQRGADLVAALPPEERAKLPPVPPLLEGRALDRG